MKAETDAIRWSADDTGEWLMIRTAQARKICGELDPGKRYDVEIKRHRERRSLDANAYCWALMTKIAASTGTDLTTLYRRYIRDVGGNAEVVCVRDKALDAFRAAWERNGIGWQTETMASKLPGCTNVVCFYGSSTYDTRQMSTLIDLVVQDAKILNIETKTPQELDALMEAWK